ncbi:MAG: ribonuclease J [Pseudomonadota bacterium]
MTEELSQAGGTSNQDEVVFLALGGLGEIGMNVYMYGLGPADDRTWLMVDLGLTFPDETEPGVDVILPDLTFAQTERKSLAGILITHAHEDHIGAVLEMWPKLRVPLYATPFTVGMLKAKLAEFGSRKAPDVREVPIGHRFTIGAFDVELISMSHSIPETSAVAIRTPHGVVLHSADWKLDPDPYVGTQTDTAKLAALGKEGVTAFICDSTNAFRDGRSPSEARVAASLSDIIKDAPRRVAVTTFSSNVARIRAIADAARASGRRLVVAGRALQRVIGVAIDVGYLPPDFDYLDQDMAKTVPAGEVLMLVTGSQGELRAALARIADNEHPEISFDPGDTVIYSSRTIPGNEKSVLRVQNKLADRGVKVITDADSLVHVTGHPRRDELAEVYGLLKPKAVIPMHGEARHLMENARLAAGAGAKSLDTVRNGQMVRLAPGPLEVVDEVPIGRMYRDGRLIIPEGEGSVRERRKLSAVGIVFVAVSIDRAGNVVAEPDATLDGVPYETADGTSMDELVLDAIDGVLDNVPQRRRRDPDALADTVKRTVRGVVDQAWGKRPIVKVLVNVVERGR